ncbi:MAG: response regulator [Pseudomonadota bacterium]
MTVSFPARHAHLVLYVEDNLANLALIEELLARRGDVQLISAGTARDGIVLASTRQPDVILMDIHLPDMSGLDALKHLRGHADTSHIPVMALSSNAYPLQIEQGIAAGFFRYLTKPFKIADFTAALDECLARVPLQAPAPPPAGCTTQAAP